VVETDDEHGARGGTAAHEVLANEVIAPDVHRLVVTAPRVAAARRPGQFAIVHLVAGAERIPLTIADADHDSGTITLVVQAVGASTRDLVAVPVGGFIHDIAGPLGRPTDLVDAGTAVCVSGGVGAAVAMPIARALAERGVRVVSIVGARSAANVLFAELFAALGEVIVCTDDGSAGRAGFVTDAVADVLVGASVDGPVDVVYAAGPVMMMRAVADITRPLGVRTIVSLNPIMVDGTGMCGGCRVTVDGAMRFACVDGPEFDGHLVDYSELADRLGTYRAAEREAASRACRSTVQ
jgi:ferredoxin--NADP+ reductase